MDPTVARILDAGANRCREALRVLEDYSRFSLNDAPLSLRLKQLRHDISRMPIPCHSRDIAGDVGKCHDIDSEYTRSSPADVVVAACRRAAEALRTLEEYGKIVDPDLGRRIEARRYELYAIERDLRVRMSSSKRFVDVRLYVLVTGSVCRLPWLEAARLAIEGGADCVQLREKGLEDRELLQRAEQIAELCRESSAISIINDRPDIAKLVGADGVHVGQDDISVAQARRILDTGKVVGLSTHTEAQIDGAVAAAPDYIAAGPMFGTTTKTGLDIAGPTLCHYAAQASSIPVVPIGGIGWENLAQLVDAGARRLCVCSAVVGQSDPAAAARRLKDFLMESLAAKEERDQSVSASNEGVG